MEELIAFIPEFFEEYSGSVADISTMLRHNHQHPSPPGDGFLTCITVRVMFDNLGIFGSSQPFLTEVFPRYRFLGAQLTEFLAEKGMPVNVPNSTIAVSIVPYPSKGGYIGNPLPKLERPSRGAHVPRVEKLAKKSEYYRKLMARYSIEHGVITNNGTVIGPDGGIIRTACMVAKVFDHRLRVIELGTGAGTTATALLALEKLGHYCGNDFSPEIVTFFNATVRPKLEAAGVTTDMVAEPCYHFNIEGKIDLFIVGVYYEGQPDLFRQKGEAIAASLDGCGVVVVQSGKPENSFITDLLYDSATSHRRWPWYEKGFCMKQYCRHVVQTVVEDETVLIGCDQAVRVDRIVRLLNQEGKG